MSANTPHAERPCAPGWRENCTFGILGLGVVVGFLPTWYPAIAGLAEEAFGLLSSTALVFLFLAAWLVLWIGLNAFLVRRAWRRATA